MNTTVPELHGPPRTTRADLFGARSVIGALVVVGVLTFMSVGLRAWDDATRNSATLDAGQVAQVTDTVAFTPAPGWVLDPAQSVPGVAVVADKDGWEIKVATGLQMQPGQTVQDFAKVFQQIPPGEAGAVVSDLESFTTTSGLQGATWTVHGADQTTITWQIAQGTAITQFLAYGTNSTLDNIRPELDQMAASVTMTGGASS